MKNLSLASAGLQSAGKIHWLAKIDWRGRLAMRETAIALASLALCVAAFCVALLDVPANSCAMTYMRPNYRAVPVPHETWGTRSSYTLYLYREGWPAGGAESAKGLPVLFIPGNAGSGKQVRSLGAQAHVDIAELVAPGGKAGGKVAELDFWAVDFDEELSALSGGDLAAQARFVCKTIPFVLAKYAGAPRGVVLVGHSMGGIVARLVAGPFCHAHYEPSHRGSSVVAVLTIATPHTGLPAMADPLLRSMFSTGEAFWRTAFSDSAASSAAAPSAISDLVLVSLGGGQRDVLVGTERSDVYQMCPSTHCLSMSATTLAGAWLSVDHQASLWCNQVVRVLTGAIRSLAVLDDGGWGWKARRPHKMQALRLALLPGARTLQSMSYIVPHATQLIQDEADASAVDTLPRAWAQWDVESWNVRLVPSSPPPQPRAATQQGGRDGRSDQDSAAEAFLRIPRVEEETIYLWRVGAVATGDGYGAAVALVSSLELNLHHWRLILCSEQVDLFSLHASVSEVAHACLKAGAGSNDISSTAVKLQGGDCHSRWNADCVPSDGAGDGVKWLLSVAAHQLRPLQFICFLGPRKASGALGPHGAWLAGLRLVPPSSSHHMLLPPWVLFDWSSRLVDANKCGGWYASMPMMPGSTSVLPATLVLEQVHTPQCPSWSPERAAGAGGIHDIGHHGGQDGGHGPLFKPLVLQTAVHGWHEGISEAWARAEIDMGDEIPVWRQQRLPSWPQHAPAAIVVLADPHCCYRAKVRVDIFAALGLAMRRHLARLLPLAAAALCLRRVFAESDTSHRCVPHAHVRLGSLMIALWLLVLAHPVVVCLFWASCSKCGSMWGCFVGGAVVSDMMSQASAPWGCASSWHVGDRDSTNWSHSEHPLISALLVAAATALSLLLLSLSTAISTLLSVFGKGANSANADINAGMNAGALRWGRSTLVAAQVGGVHPVLAAICALVTILPLPPAATASRTSELDKGTKKHEHTVTSDISKRSARSPAVTGAHLPKLETSPSTCTRAHATSAAREERMVLGALTLLCVILRLPGFVALVRCLVISAKGPQGRWEVYYQSSLGPSLESWSAGPLAVGVSAAVSFDLIVALLLPVVARVYVISRSSPSTATYARGEGGGGGGGGRAQSRAGVWDWVWCGCCGMGIVMAQQDVYVITWVTLFFFAECIVARGRYPAHLWRERPRGRTLGPGLQASLNLKHE